MGTYKQFGCPNGAIYLMVPDTVDAGLRRPFSSGGAWLREKCDTKI